MRGRGYCYRTFVRGMMGAMEAPGRDALTEYLARIGPKGAVPAVRCPHCGGRRLTRWGWLLGRQRYRCGGCRKTFTTLTGTPQAYSKLPEKWPEIVWCMAERLPVRQTAARLGIHPSTALRWRHRLLAALEKSELPALGGVVEVTEFYYPDCHKGERRLGRPPRRRGLLASQFRGGLCVVVARDREQRTLVRLTGLGVPVGGRLDQALLDSLAPGSVVCTEKRHWYYSFCRRNFLRHEVTLDLRKHWITRKGLRRLCEREPSLAVFHLCDVTACRDRLRWWLRGFRGVAVRYLPGYLAWFRSTEGWRGAIQGWRGAI